MKEMIQVATLSLALVILRSLKNRTQQGVWLTPWRGTGEPWEPEFHFLTSYLEVTGTQVVREDQPWGPDGSAGGSHSWQGGGLLEGQEAGCSGRNCPECMRSPLEGLLPALKYRDTEAHGGDITCRGWLCCHVRAGLWPGGTKAPVAQPPRTGFGVSR